MGALATGYNFRLHLSLPLVLMLSLFPRCTTSTFCPPKCDCSSDHTVINCSHRVLFSVPPLPPTARSVDLSRNFLGPSLNGSIIHLHNLTNLDLSDNDLELLTDCSLVGLQKLLRLNLSRNRLSDFPEALFDPKASLQVLDLSHNIFTELPDAAFKNLVKVTSVNFSHNSLEMLRFGVRWQWLKDLEDLDLSHNDFREIPTDAFEMTHLWPPAVKRRLSLAHGRLESVRNRSLSQFQGLHSLSLSGNGRLNQANLTAVLREVEHTRLKELDISSLNISTIGDLFHSFQHLALTRLDMADNAIDTVPNDTFITLRSLQWLSLAGNRLSRLEPGMAALGNLKGLDLSSNALESFRGRVTDQLGQLEYLNLANNRLMLSSDVNLSAMRQLRELNLESNRLNRLVLPATTDHLERLLVANNSITALPSLARMGELRHFDISGNELMNLGPYLLASARNLQVADFRDNLIEEVDSRTFLPASPKVVHLSKNSLRRLGYVSWVGTQEIYIQDNRLEELDLQTFHNMGNLTKLDLSRNNLSSVAADVFRHLGNLQRLDLHGNVLNFDPTNAVALFGYLSSLQHLDLGHNNLTFLNASTFQGCPHLKTIILSNNQFTVLDPALFENIPNLQSFDATNNPFHCSCELIPFRKWLGTTDLEVLTPENGTYACKSPPWRTAKDISFYIVSRFECNLSLYYMIIFGTVGAIIIVTGVFSSILVHQYLKRRHLMKIKLGRQRDKSDTKDQTDLKVDRVRFEHHDSMKKNQYLENLTRDPYAFDKKQALEYRHDPYPIILSHPLILVEKKRGEEHEKKRGEDHHKKKDTNKKEDNKKRDSNKRSSSSVNKKHQQIRERSSSSSRTSQRLHNLLRYYTFDPRSQRELLRASQLLARAAEHDKDRLHYHTLPRPGHFGDARDLRPRPYDAPYWSPRVMPSRSYLHLPEGQGQRQNRDQEINLTRAHSAYPLMTREDDLNHPRMSKWI